jgi:hypothetical protein
MASYPTESLAGWETLLGKLVDLQYHDPNLGMTRESRPPSANHAERAVNEDDEGAHKKRLNKWQQLKERLSIKSKNGGGRGYGNPSHVSAA